MSIILFALIGAKIDAGVVYWVCFGLYCAAWTFGKLMKLASMQKEKENVKK